MNMPLFRAEAALERRADARRSQQAAAEPRGNDVHLALRAWWISCTTVQYSCNDEKSCGDLQDFCRTAGGGMSSNSDGSQTCSFRSCKRIGGGF
jgi:hypothetical protein